MSIRLTPPSERGFPGTAPATEGATRIQISGAPAVPMRHRPRRALVLAAALAIAGILAAAGYGGYRLTHGAIPVPTIGCYETDSLDANTAVLRAGENLAPRSLFRHLRVAFPHSQLPARFAACVLPSGSIGVFPGDTQGDTCKSLGLTEAP